MYGTNRQARVHCHAPEEECACCSVRSPTIYEDNEQGYEDDAGSHEDTRRRCGTLDSVEERAVPEERPVHDSRKDAEREDRSRGQRLLATEDPEQWLPEQDGKGADRGD